MTWSHCCRCTLINSRAAWNAFTTIVNGTWKVYINDKKPAVLPGQNVAMKGEIAKTALSCPSHGIFAWLPIINLSPWLYFWLQKHSITSALLAEFKVKVNSTCATIRNYDILIVIYYTRMHPTTSILGSLMFSVLYNKAIVLLCYLYKTSSCDTISPHSRGLGLWLCKLEVGSW